MSDYGGSNDDDNSSVGGSDAGGSVVSYGGADDYDNSENGDLDEEQKEDGGVAEEEEDFGIAEDGEEGDVPDDVDDDDDEAYLHKLTTGIDKDYVATHHQECLHQNYDEVMKLSIVVRDANNIIIDDLHKSLPLLTKYERTKILGLRAIQINSGARPFVEVPPNIIDGYVIAQLELAAKKIPFIIKRPIGNGQEFWKVSDLENVLFD